MAQTTYPFFNFSQIREIEKQIDFIINHFPKEYLFPRTISTMATGGKQIPIYNKHQILSNFRECGFVDCRINAFPYGISSGEINDQSNMYQPDFIFIDLDLSSFSSKQELYKALADTLDTIKEKLGGYPTVLWSGNGYHIYQPIDAIILEKESSFSDFSSPSRKFLKYAPQYLSNNFKDANHNPSFKSCLIRVPSTYNGKCLAKGLSLEDSKVKIVQRWNGDRPNIRYMLKDFAFYLADVELKEELKEIELNSKIKQRRNHRNSYPSYYRWIERLLEIPIEDSRKYTLLHIIGPYLVNVKGLSYQQSFNIMVHWLERCHQARPVDFNKKSKVKEILNGLMKSTTKYSPMKLETLKQKNKNLYNAFFIS